MQLTSLNPSLSTIALDKMPTTSRRRSFDRRLYVGVTFVLIGLNLAAFGPSLIEPSARAVPLPLTPLVAVHAAVSAAWLLVFLVQTILVAKGRTAVHRRLGIAGVLLAAAFVATGPLVAIGEALEASTSVAIPYHVAHPRARARYCRFFHLPLVRAAGGGSRLVPPPTRGAQAADAARDPRSAHGCTRRAPGRALGCPAAVAAGSLIANAVLLAVLPIDDRLTRGRVHPVSRWGAILVFLWFILTFVVVAPTPAWQHFAEWLAR